MASRHTERSSSQDQQRQHQQGLSTYNTSVLNSDQEELDHSALPNHQKPRIKRKSVSLGSVFNYVRSSVLGSDRLDIILSAPAARSSEVFYNIEPERSTESATHSRTELTHPTAANMDHQDDTLPAAHDVTVHMDEIAPLTAEAATTTAAEATTAIAGPSPIAIDSPPEVDTNRQSSVSTPPNNSQIAFDGIDELIAPVPREVPHKNKDGTYSIRLTPYVDSASNSVALYFGPVVRKLKPGNTIAIGRYTEKNKEALVAPSNSSAPVVFKSKVVSRVHAEIAVNEYGEWFIKDLKSSSGTFLNHRRLSLANQESGLMPFNEGDLLQLGMDFRGGTEEIYRCVKMRIELNKSWIRRTKTFSKEAHERIKQLNPDLADQIQCVICLEDIKPCQAVFVSPCSHSYHYKCIRRVILKTYPQFLCPTCRALTDLEADEDESDSDDEV